MVKCVCVGSRPDVAMLCAMGVISGKWPQTYDELAERGIVLCRENLAGWLCSRESGHDGPHVACRSHGINEIERHNLTSVKF